MTGRAQHSSLATRGALMLLAGYQRFLSPVLHALFGSGCRFSPTCSAYAAQVIAGQGVVRGTIRAILRVLRCHPWHPGGFDPPYPGRGPQDDGRRLE